jgi:excisionase family DNA binding protein
MEDDVLQRKTLLKPREVAARLDVPLSTIYVWYQLGKIEGVSVNGRSIRIFSESLRKLLKSRNHEKVKVGTEPTSARTDP